MRKSNWFREAWVTLVRTKPLGCMGGVMVLILVIMAIFAPLIAPYSPNEIKSADRLLAPSSRHLLGTDNFGRDIFSRIIYGARISMYVGIGAVFLSTFFATVIGVICGYYGGKIDTIIQRGVDAFMAFPWLVIILTIMAILGPGLVNVILALGIGAISGNSRIIRSAVFSIKENQYIEGARSTGCKNLRIIQRYILPNIAAPIIVIATLGLGWAILAESALSFLGFGVPPPEPSWGGMLSGEGRTYMIKAPWMAIFPGIAISTAVFGFNMLGDALRDILDPKLRMGKK
ncbi:MAG: ABC transporter permease [Candidatus Tectomicrobia bacterium]|uniref:ABC transporter permease n=1 Tax=Tectimicrobiota bacterium TaxID=2528274 RepID=A0A933LQI7_UNCTE|nr:ABC transporter permease [Candidatus Tectomicrobia bacterium]